MSTSLLEFPSLPSKRRYFHERVLSARPSLPETTGVITSKWSCSEHKERIDQIATAVSHMQSLMNEAAIIEATSNVKPLGSIEIARFMQLQSTLQTYIDRLADVELPEVHA